MKPKIRLSTDELGLEDGVLASEEGDYPRELRQSTLYNWWLGRAREIGNLQEGVAEINNALHEVERLMESGKGSSLDRNSAIAIETKLSQLQNPAQRIAQAFEACKRTMDSERIPASLKRFDKWFRLFLSSQNLRWFFFNLFIPILLSVAAIVLLAVKIWSPDIR